MAGIYIHIPYCKKRCHYCDFYFVTNTASEKLFVDALKFEIQSRNLETSEVIETIYFGGGTPSIIQPKFIADILKYIHQNFKVINSPEITLEANPDDLTIENLDAFYQAGINRLSVGIQSFRDEHLIWMNRSHNANDALTVIDRASKIGFSDFSIDLIYGIPGMTDEDWMEQLKIAASLPVNHLSCYCLTVEPKTRLHKLIKENIYKSPDDELQAKQFLLLMETAPSLGFEHYEISNFARNGHYSKHNSAYWNAIPYLGFGPSAHSFDGTARTHNPSSLTKYIENPLNSIKELLSENEKYNEYILIALRTIKGIDIQKIQNQFSESINQHFQQHIFKMKEHEHGYIENNFFKLNNAGRLYADRIALDFFIV